MKKIEIYTQNLRKIFNIKYRAEDNINKVKTRMKEEKVIIFTIEERKVDMMGELKRTISVRTKNLSDGSSSNIKKREIIRGVKNI